MAACMRIIPHTTRVTPGLPLHNRTGGHFGGFLRVSDKSQLDSRRLILSGCEAWKTAGFCGDVHLSGCILRFRGSAGWFAGRLRLSGVQDSASLGCLRLLSGRSYLFRPPHVAVAADNAPTCDQPFFGELERILLRFLRLAGGECPARSGDLRQDGSAGQ